MKDKSTKKSRNWQAIVYPESAPDDWQDILKSLAIPGFISPLHDKDKQPDGTLKKPHYHVILIWDGPTTDTNARKVFEQFGGVMQPIPIQSLVGATRYLCHLDDADKYQYPTGEVVSMNGTNYLEQISKNANDTLVLKKVFTYIRENDITEYCDLIDRIEDEALDDFFTVVTRMATWAVNSYLTSRRSKKKPKEQTRILMIKAETGEIMQEVTLNED